MANKTLSIGFKVEDGAGGLKTITNDANELRAAMKALGGQSKDTRTQMEKLGDVSFGIDAIANAVNALQGAMQSSVNAYNAQIEAETKLETVMRQRMSATEEEIQSIKNLCSAQQQIGVIGDEVQLAGAQQISTFITQKATIETLIPAMNNLVAQQKGLSATSSDAVNIANILGKAMQGQTSALRRVGITFSEAEEKAVKYGTEQERAAALAKIITNNVGEMNTQLAQTPAGQMKQLANNMGDLQEKIGGVAKNFLPAIQMVNQFVMLGGSISKVTTALGMVRTEIMKLKGTATNSAVSVKLLGHELTATGTASKACAIAFKGSMMIMKTALISTGIGAAIWAIGEGIAFLVNKLAGVKDAANNASDALEGMRNEQEELNRAHADAQAKLTLHIAEIKNFTGTKEEERKKVEELNNTYGDVMGTMSTLSQWYEALSSKSELYCKNLVLQARAQILAKKIAEGASISYNLEKTGKEINSTQQSGTGPANGLTSVPSFNAQDNGNPILQAAQKEMQKQNAKLQEGVKKVQRVYEDELSEVMKQLSENSKALRVDVSSSNQKTHNPSARVVASKQKPKEELAPEGSMAFYKKQISNIEQNISLEPDPKNIAVLEQEKAKIEEKIARLQAIIEFRLKYDNDDEKIKAAIENDPVCVPLEVEVDTEQLTNELKTIAPIFTKSLNAQKIEKCVNATQGLQTSLKGVGDVGRELSGVFSSMGDAFEDKDMNVAGIIAGAIANIAAGAAAAIAQGASLGPVGWAAFSLSATAQMIAMIAQVKKATAFANGGIVSGPTMALVGEYAGASNNPEVIAPLDKLRSLIGSPQGAQAIMVGGDVRVKGSDLMIALRNEKRLTSISGRASI